MDFVLAPEEPDQRCAIEELLDRCFGADRRRKVSYRYRDGLAPISALSFVAAEPETRLVGSIRFWPILLEATPALLLGPLAIAPERQGRGIGRALTRYTLARAAALGHRVVFLVGDPAFYSRFGFVPAPPGVTMPGEDPARLQWQAVGGAALPERGGRILRVDGSLPFEPANQGRPHAQHVLVA